MHFFYKDNKFSENNNKKLCLTKFMNRHIFQEQKNSNQKKRRKFAEKYD